MIDNYSNIVDTLAKAQNLTDSELALLIETEQQDNYLSKIADKVRREIYSNDVYLRGLIEITNYCKNDCFYCGIRKSNRLTQRYRLSEEEILACCREGYELGFRTFVLQGGEDQYFTDDRICSIVSKIRASFPDCAITLSIGEKSYESYKRFYESGANRYLLRHETAEDKHYKLLHPDSQSLQNRKESLFNLKKIGYQVGSGFMVGSPYQTTKNLISDLRFLQELKPDMIGIGPFISHYNTPFAKFPNGDLQLTLRMISIVRLMFPYALIPSTTALGSIDKCGRELGLQSGANVVMPNLSPYEVRKKYDLYDNKISTGVESAQSKVLLEEKIKNIGYTAIVSRGDVKKRDDI